MKKSTPFLMLLLLIQHFTANAQVTRKIGERETLVGGRYLFTETKSFTVAKDRFNADTDINKDDFVEIVSDNENGVFYKKIGDSTNTLYSMPKTDFFYYTDERFQRYKGAEVGVYSIPFRLRGSGDDFDFESSLSLQANIVFGLGSKKVQESFLDLSAGIGLSSINLNETNSNVTENRTASALTLSVGAVVKPAKHANIGVFFGGDFLGQSDKDVDWKYNKNLWIGIGINISFNKIETEEPAKTK